MKKWLYVTGLLLFLAANGVATVRSAVGLGVVPLNAKLAKVPGKSAGPSIMLKVMAGDRVSISAKAFYNMDNALPGQGIDITPIAGNLISTLANPAAGIAGEAAQLAADLGATASQSVALVNLPQTANRSNEVKPQSGINFILYNNGMDIVKENTGILPVEDRINEIQTLATDDLIIQEAGFLEIFVSNDAQTPVYYDNLTVMHTPGRVLEVNTYYPYGMLIAELSTPALPGEWNGYKYSAKELETALNIGYYNFGQRMLDPTIGRFMVPDRFAEKYYHLSPYQYAANNPINIIDINGDSLWIFKPDGTYFMTLDDGKETHSGLYMQDSKRVNPTCRFYPHKINKNGCDIIFR